MSVGKFDQDAAPLAVLGADADGAPEAGDDLPREVESDARAGLERGDLGEAFEDPLLLLGRDADARVADGDVQRAALPVVAAGERDASRGGEFGGVVQQVIDDARQVEGVGGYLDTPPPLRRRIRLPGYP